MLAGIAIAAMTAGLAGAQEATPRYSIGNGAGSPDAAGGTANVPGVPGMSPQGAGGASAGSAQLFAVVNANGTTARGKGNRSSNRSSTGTYQVRFWRNIRGCGYTATIGLGGASGTSSPGEVTVVGEAASVTGVFVQTYNSAGTLTDRGFHLYVDC
jgi:hypothetical protein